MFGVRSVLSMLASSNQCRRRIVGQFLDDNPVSCVDLPNPHLCDFCVRELAHVSSKPLSTPSRPVNSMVAKVDSAIYRRNTEMTRARVLFLNATFKGLTHACPSCYIRSIPQYSDHVTDTCSFFPLNAQHKAFNVFKAGKAGFALPAGICWECTLPQVRFFRVSQGFTDQSS